MRPARFRGKQPEPPVTGTDRDSGFRVLWRLAPFVKPDKLLGLFVLLLAIGSAQAAATGPKLIGKAISGPIARHDKSGLLHALILVALVFIAGFLLQMAQLYLLGVIAQRVLRRLRVALLEAVNRIDISFLDRRPIGDLIARVSGDLNRIASLFGQSLTESFGSIVRLFIVVINMLTLDWRLALASFVVLPLNFATSLIFSRRLVATTTVAREAAGLMTGSVEEALAGMRVAQAFNRTDLVEQGFREVNAQSRNANLRTISWADAPALTTTLLSALSLAIVLSYGAYLAVHGEATVGTVVAFILYVQQFGRPVQQAANLYSTVQATVPSVLRVVEVIDAPVSLSGAPDARDLGPGPREVAFDHVSFGYVPGRPAIEDVDFTIPPGKTFAVVGESGAGKSTLVNLLARFYDPNAGAIKIDGQDVRHIRLASLRGELAVIPQQSTIFSGTVATNIRYGRLDASQQEIEAFAKLVNAHEFISRLPHGYDTPVGPRGITLSQGQRQLLVFARTLIKNPRIIVLDEATSTLDNETERLVQDALNTVLGGRTSLVIAHRLSTIRHADQILVMDSGRIIERGSHDQLMAMEGVYAGLVTQQQGALLRTAIDPDRLRAVPLLARLDAKYLAELAGRMEMERFVADDVIVRQGEYGDKVYFIEKGEVDVVVGAEERERKLATLRDGDYFGEMALLTGRPRTATVRAASPTDAFSLSQASFAGLLEHEPILRDLLVGEMQRRSEALSPQMASVGA